MQLLKDIATLAWEDGGSCQCLEPTSLPVNCELAVHPSLHFISHLPSSIEGEQLIAQFFRSIPDQQWLFKYGRVPMSFILSDHLWKVQYCLLSSIDDLSNILKRISAPLSANERCKLTVIAEATADCSYAMQPEALLPYPLHFHPARPSASTSPDARKHNTRRVGNPFQAINIIPREEQVCRSVSHAF